VLYIQPFDIIGRCFANYGQVGITQTWTLAKGRQGGRLVRHRHKVAVLLWRAASHVLFICGDFPDFGHETKYAPFGMLGKPESTTLIKGAHYPKFRSAAVSSCTVLLPARFHHAARRRDHVAARCARAAAGADAADRRP